MKEMSQWRQTSVAKEPSAKAVGTMFTRNNNRRLMGVTVSRSPGSIVHPREFLITQYPPATIVEKSGGFEE